MDSPSEPGYLLKFHGNGRNIVVAICDEEILGKTFREGDVILAVPASFYGGRRVGIEEVVAAIMEADVAVISGKRVVTELVKRGIVSLDFVLKVQDQLHVQIVREVIGGP